MNCKTILKVAGVAVSAMMLVGCGGDDGDGGNPGNNAPGNNPGGGGSGCAISAYRTVKIGSQTWMAENLNCNTSSSKCYDNDPANCTKYGRLYTWVDAKNVCPAGWHLPSSAEWTTLRDSAGYPAAGKLKSASGWNEGNNSTDEYGFSALPGGQGLIYSNGIEFREVGSYGYWWTTEESQNNDIFAWYRYMSWIDNLTITRDFNSKTEALLSVRCVKN